MIMELLEKGVAMGGTAGEASLTGGGQTMKTAAITMNTRNYYAGQFRPPMPG